MEPHEVWASPTTLLTLDGRVLEVFGFADAQRFHLAFRPVLQRSAKLVAIKPEQGPKLSFFYDRENAERLDAFARLLEAAHPPR
jgi:hypothetical protein